MESFGLDPRIAATDMSGMKLGLKHWFDVLRRVWMQIDELNLSLVAAGIGFWGVMSLFPALAAMIAVWGLISDPVELQTQLEELQAAIPRDIFTVINAQITALISTRSQTLGLASLVSLGFALWSARAGVGALMRGLNMIHGSPNRSGLRHYVDAIWLTVLLIFVALVAMASVVIAPLVLAYLRIGGQVELWIDILRWVIALVAVIFAVGVLYRFGPYRSQHRRRWLSPGAVLFVLVWVAASAGFSIYLSRFGNYNQIYGSIGAVIALLIWFYISAFLVLLGASFNRALEQIEA